MDLWVRILMAANVLSYRLSNGRLGSTMAGQTVLLLNTVGRKSGKSYTTPINYFRDGDNYLLVASNWGKDHHPAWFFNLMHQPSTVIQVKDQKLRIQARQVADEEYERLWQYVTGKNQYYVKYQKQTTRRIPIVVLTPQA
jgi:F420H(2)-dependent quinone reductase